MGLTLTIQLNTISQLILKAEGNCIMHISYRICLSICFLALWHLLIVLLPVIPAGNTDAFVSESWASSPEELNSSVHWPQWQSCKLSPRIDQARTYYAWVGLPAQTDTRKNIMPGDVPFSSSCSGRSPKITLLITGDCCGFSNAAN